MAGRDEEDRGDGRRARWEQHNQDRRQLILRAAVGVVESQPPGADFHVHQIAERAGLPRAAVYRHFADRADLDRAIREHVLGQVKERLFAAFRLEGSIDETIGRIMSAYVDWAAAHPALHRLGDTATGSGDQPGPLHETLQQIAAQVLELINLATTAFRFELSERDTEAMDLFVFGIVAEMMGIVRHWLWRPTRVPDAPTLARLMSGLVWSQLDGLARDRGLVLDPSAPLDRLVAGAPQPPE